jgi:hypothetical protein
MERDLFRGESGSFRPLLRLGSAAGTSFGLDGWRQLTTIVRREITILT